MLPSHRSPALSVRSPRNPVGKPGLCIGTGYSLALPVLGSSRPRNCSPKLEYQAVAPACELLAEARSPGDAVGIDDDVMRLDGLARQIIFGDDHAGAAAFRARQRVECVVPRRA